MWRSTWRHWDQADGIRASVTHLDNLGSCNALQDKLSHAISALDLKVFLGVVEKDDADIATVVCIDLGVDNASLSQIWKIRRTDPPDWLCTCAEYWI